ncbi:MAG TPA: polysaccharide deacetylase family protein [Vicinamibacterales bacterium]|nr:polysaccharide deacetylase family protein [Vicinamibacterales bacterium]
MAYAEVAPAPVSPEFFRPVTLPAGHRPQLFVIVDTEEEFDWSAPFSRSSVGVTAIDDVGRLQNVLLAYGAIPTYVIDYPVATTATSVARLGELAARGECHIGAHLHPWVNPPYVEDMSRPTSYACNLGHDLEHDKIAHLRAAIVEHLHVVPRVYKAGRYGFGQTTAEILDSLGFDVDASVNPHMDFRGDGGPSFEGFAATPAFFGRHRRLLELPCTTGFVGAARRMGPSLHKAASTRWLEPLRAVGVLARSGALNKVMLSPEGNTFDEMQMLTSALHSDGVRTFSLTLHSPSLKPGCTPYARTIGERDALVSTIDRFCDYFFGKLGGAPGTPAGLYDQLLEDTRS